MLLESMHPEADGLIRVPEPRRLLELRVGDVGELAQHPPVYLEERVPDALDGPVNGILRRRVGLTELRPLVIRWLVVLACAVVHQRPTVHGEETVLRAEHVLQRLPQRPLALGRRAVEVLAADAREQAGQ